MKTIISFPLILILWCDFLFAQEKQYDFEIKNKYTPVQLIPGSHNEFYILCEERVYKNVIGNVLFKFDQDLNSHWEEPTVIKSAILKGDYLGTAINIFGQEAIPGETPITYLVKNNDYLQLLPDGTSQKIEWDIPGKELKNKVAATFADKNGLNLLTIVGDETFPTGKLNWYQITGKDNKQTKRSIELPLPPQIDKDNESGWRLNEVTPEGELFFYYVSYKNKVKDESRPILACHVIGVNAEGKAGKLVSMDLGLKSYNALTVNFLQSGGHNLLVSAPDLYHSGIQGTSHIPTDNAFMGVKIDSKSRRIYLVIAQNDELDVANDGRIKYGAGKTYPVKSLGVYAFDFDGNKLAQTKLKNTPVKLGATDNYGYMANMVKICPLAAGEGALIKFVNNGNGCFWHINDKGEEVMENKFKLSKEKMTRRYPDLFAANYCSIDEFKKSPYALGGQSKVVQRLDKLPEDKKLGAGYMSLDEVEILAIWDNKKNIMSLHSFTKN